MSCRFLLFIACGYLPLAFIGGCGKKAPPPAVAGKETPGDGPKPAETGRSLDQIVADLKHKTPEKRLSAIREIAQKDPADSIPALVTLLADKTFIEGANVSGEPNSARETALITLLKLGPAGQAAAVEKGLPILAKALMDPSSGIKEHALLALELLGPRAKSSAGDILILCENDDEAVRRAAFHALSKIGADDPVAYALMLDNKDPKIGYDAARALNAIRPLPKDLIPVIADVIAKPTMMGEAEETALTRLELAEALGSCGADAKEAIPGLIAYLKALTLESFSRLYTPKSRQEATWRTAELPPLAALRKIGKPAVPELVNVVNIEVNSVDALFTRWLAIIILAEIGPDAKEAIPALKTLFDKETERLELEMITIGVCALAIVRLGDETTATAVVTKLANLLDLSTPKQRLVTAEILARFGRKGGPAVAAMVKLLDDPDEQIRKQAIETLRAFGPVAKEAVPVLAKKLADPDADVRREAIYALKSFGRLAIETAPELSKRLGEPDEAVRRDVIEAIIALGPGAKADALALGKMIKAPEERERLLAIEALGSIGAEAKPVLADLVADLRDIKIEVTTRVAISRTLGQIGLATPEVVAALSERLSKGQTIERRTAARALATLGPAAKAAAPALEKLGTSLDPSAKVWSASALYKMGIDRETNLQVIIAVLKNSAERQTRLAAMDVADLLGPTARGILPELMEALGDKSAVSKFDPTPVSTRAAQALGKMGPAAKDAVKKLTALLKEPDVAQKEAVIEALRQIGPDAKFAIARLREVVLTEPVFAEKAQEALDLIDTVP